MEEAISLILRGCSLARQLEFDVLNLGSNNINVPQPHLMARSCDEILGVFSAAKERLSSHEQWPPFTAVQREVGLEEWLRSTCSQAMELAQMQTRSPAPPSAVVAVPVPAAVEDSGKLIAMGFSSSSSSSSTKARRRYSFLNL